MDESFQDYSKIQDFEADFLWKVRLKIMNWQIIIASDLFSDYLKISDLLNVLFLIFYMGMLQVFRIELLKFSILEI